ncbi:MAG TPA: MEDS domain-containing protein [Bryobacteraceae bacterium]|nr:MEDS domain-containing protein [Bryobacteraceae bacterium]
MTPWEKLLERPHSRGHFVQLYRADGSALAKNVGLYVHEGLKRGDGILLIVTPEHRDMFCSYLDELGANTRAIIATGQIVILDAQQALAEFMVKGQPDWHRFQATITAAAHRVHKATEHAGLRAYGEMVGVLWKARQFDAAIRLEQLWNKLLEQSSFSLYCAYAIDLFGNEFHVANLDGVLCTHTHLVPADPHGTLEAAFNLAMDDILGESASALKVLIKADYRPSRAIMPNAEAMALWLRKNLPARAEEIVARARQHYLTLKPGSPLV